LTNDNEVCHYLDRASHAMGIPFKQHAPGLFYNPEIHLGRVFRNGCSFKRAGRIVCDKCSCLVTNGSYWWKYNGFGAAANSGMQICYSCYQNIMQDPLFLTDLITNTKVTITMEAQIAHTVYWYTPHWYPRNQTWRDPITNCLIWTGRVNNDGYGIIHISGIDLFTHRISYMNRPGRSNTEGLTSINVGKEVMHVCDRVSDKAKKPNRRCFNHSHLRQGSHTENMDAIKRANPTRRKKRHEK